MIPNLTTWCLYNLNHNILPIISSRMMSNYSQSCRSILSGRLFHVRLIFISSEQQHFSSKDRSPFPTLKYSNTCHEKHKHCNSQARLGVRSAAAVRHVSCPIRPHFWFYLKTVKKILSLKFNFLFFFDN